MIAGAVAAHLRTAGLSPVRLAELGDYVAGAGPVWTVYDEPGEDVPRLGVREEEIYAARLQIRARDDDMRLALAAARLAFDHVRGAVGLPLADEGRAYRIIRYAVRTRPTWYPTATPGEVATLNLDLWVREL